MSDVLVPLTTAVGALLAAVVVRGWGARGRPFGASVAAATLGTFLVASMTAHNVEVAVGWVVGGSLTGSSPPPLDVRTYGLLLLGGVLTVAGAVALRAVPGLSQGDGIARRSALRAVGATVAVTAPLLVVHPFFGVLVTGAALLAAVPIALAPTPTARTRAVPFPRPLQAVATAEPDGPVALLIGASPEGLALGRTLIEAGAHVVAADPDPYAAAQLAAALGPRALCVPVDPATEFGGLVIRGFLRAEFGGADLVVRSAAGSSLREGSLLFGLDPRRAGRMGTVAHAEGAAPRAASSHPPRLAGDPHP